MAMSIIRRWSEEGNEIDVQYEDGFFDATSLAASFGKQAYEYLRMQRTKDYLEQLALQLGLPSGIDGEGGENAIVVTRQGGSNFHPRLMIDYGRWLNIKFAVWIDAWVFQLLSGSAAPAQPTADDFDGSMVRPERLYHQQAVLINEIDLHTTVVRAIRAQWPTTLFTAGLGEMQDTDQKRIEGWRKGYLKGHPDLLIFEKTKEFTGLAIEFKSPGMATAVASEAQDDALRGFQRLGWKTLVSNDYGTILITLSDYMRASLWRCDCCRHSDESLDDTDWDSQGAKDFVAAYIAYLDGQAANTKTHYPKSLDRLKLSESAEAFVKENPNAFQLTGDKVKEQRRTTGAIKRRRVVESSE